MKNTIRVSNLTLDLYLDYVLPAAIKAGIVEEISINGGKDHVAEEALAAEIESDMRCACFNAGYDGIERTHDEYIAHEAEQMLYQIDVSIKYCKDSMTVKALQALREAMTAEDEAEEEEAEEEATAEQIVAAVTEKVEQTKTRSAWERGVKEYAEELLEELSEAVEGGYVDESDLSNRRLFEKAMLNGAGSWDQYSEGGCSLCYDGQIAERLCAPWELKKTDGGRKNPNPRENWIDVQSRALFQASQMILRAAF